MRKVIAEAEVGDHTLGDDPTANELERYAADLLGKESALFFPSGIMANQTAIIIQTTPGTEVVLDADAHILHYEEGAASAWAGVQLRPVDANDGLPDPERFAAAIRPASPYLPVCSLVCLENTHNIAGGRIVPVELMAGVTEVARERGIRIHLDGARLPNAAIAANREMRHWAALADTVMVSLSKGLGAPFGSVLAGAGADMDRARRVRRRLGGGMRQIGLLAAAGLYALQNNYYRLAEDHALASDLARRLAALPGISPRDPDTNIVMIEIDPSLGPAREVAARLEADGVRVVEFGTTRIRAVLHKDVDDNGVAAAVAAFERLVGGGVEGRRRMPQ